MKKNESGIDRGIRIVLGAILIIVGIVEIGASLALAAVLIIVGAIVLITGITGFCALYSLFGISTCKQ